MIKENEQFLEYYRSALKAMLEVQRVSLESAERLRTRQLAAVHKALAGMGESIAEIDKAKDFHELLALQGKLATAQMEGMAGYWNNLTQAAGANQAAAIALASKRAANLREKIHEAQAAVAGDSGPMAAALKALVEATRSAFDVGLRATKAAAGAPGKTEGDTAEAGIRTGAAPARRKSA